MSISNIDRALYERNNMAVVINELEEKLGDALAERDAMKSLFEMCPAIDFRRELNLDQEVIGYNISGWDNEGNDFGVSGDTIDNAIRLVINSIGEINL